MIPFPRRPATDLPPRAQNVVVGHESTPLYLRRLAESLESQNGHLVRHLTLGSRLGTPHISNGLEEVVTRILLQTPNVSSVILTPDLSVALSNSPHLGSLTRLTVQAWNYSHPVLANIIMDSPNLAYLRIIDYHLDGNQGIDAPPLVAAVASSLFLTELVLEGSTFLDRTRYHEELFATQKWSCPLKSLVIRDDQLGRAGLRQPTLLSEFVAHFPSLNNLVIEGHWLPLPTILASISLPYLDSLYLSVGYYDIDCYDSDREDSVQDLLRLPILFADSPLRNVTLASYAAPWSTVRCLEAALGPFVQAHKDTLEHIDTNCRWERRPDGVRLAEFAGERHGIPIFRKDSELDPPECGDDYDSYEEDEEDEEAEADGERSGGRGGGNDERNEGGSAMESEEDEEESEEDAREAEEGVSGTSNVGGDDEEGSE